MSDSVKFEHDGLYAYRWNMAAINEPMRLEDGEEKIEYLEVYWDFDADKFQGETTCGMSTGSCHSGLVHCSRCFI